MPPEGFGKNSGRDYRDRAVDISCADAYSDQRKHIQMRLTIDCQARVRKSRPPKEPPESLAKLDPLSDVSGND